MKNLLTFCLALHLLSACGRGGERQQLPVTAFDRLLSQGRLHRFFQQQNGDSWSLVQTHAEISDWQKIGDSPYAGWIRFDTAMMPETELAHPADALSFVVQHYGSMLADLQASEWIPAKRFIRYDESRVMFNYTRKVQDLAVRDNILQIILQQTEPGHYRLAEIQSNVSGPAPQLESKPHKVPSHDWLEELTGRNDLQIQDSFDEWVPFLDNGQFQWMRATVFEWLMEGESYRATLISEQGVWLDAYPLAVHTKPILTNALKRSYAEDGLREYPLSYSVTDSPAGNFILGAEALLPNGFLPNSVSLNGPRAMIFDTQVPNGLTYQGLQQSESGFFLPDDASRLAAVNAFVSVQRINRFARQFLSTSDAPFLDQPLMVNVNLTDQSCNAFYSPKQKRMLLYKEGNNCANMALLNDVIYHEWGHALDDNVGRTAGITDPAFSEGLADVIAAYYNNDPAIAPFFVFDDPEPIRNLTDAREYPRDKGPMHFEGGIIAGTFWELRRTLIDRYGLNRGAHLAGRFFFRHLLAVDSYLESYAAVLRLDDDDGNPATRSPNHCLINSVFAHYGLTSAESCEDPPVTLSGVSKDLTMSLLDAGPEENAVHVVASAPEAASLVLCLGPRALCLNNQPAWITLQKIGKSPERTFFTSSSPVLLSQLAMVSLIRLDASGQVRDSRELKIFAK